MKSAIIPIVLLILVCIGGFFWYRQTSTETAVNTPPPAPSPQVATTTPLQNTQEEVIGKSVQGRDIVAYHFGSGQKEVLFIGGIHGGYSWNTALVAGELVTYLKGNQSAVPQNVRVTVIPVMNPDGLYKTL